MHVGQRSSQNFAQLNKCGLMPQLYTMVKDVLEARKSDRTVPHSCDKRVQLKTPEEKLKQPAMLNAITGLRDKEARRLQNAKSNITAVHE